MITIICIFVFLSISPPVTVVLFHYYLYFYVIIIHHDFYYLYICIFVLITVYKMYYKDTGGGRPIVQPVGTTRVIRKQWRST